MGAGLPQGAGLAELVRGLVGGRWQDGLPQDLWGRGPAGGALAGGACVGAGRSAWGARACEGRAVCVSGSGRQSWEGNVWKALEPGRGPAGGACLKLIKNALFGGFISRGAVPTPGVARRSAHHRLSASQWLTTHARPTASGDAAKNPTPPTGSADAQAEVGGASGYVRPPPSGYAPCGHAPSAVCCCPRGPSRSWRARALFPPGWVCPTPAVSCGRKRPAGAQLSW